MQWILIIVAVIIALIIVFYLVILIAFLFSFSNGGKSPEYDIIKELEWLLGNKNLLNYYKVLEFEAKMVDSKRHLVIQLEDVAFKNIIDIISETNSNNQINNSNNSINDTWILSSTGFYLNAEFVKNNSHKDYRISVEGDFNQKTITYNSGYILGSC
jgi:hypothetical protein